MEGRDSVARHYRTRREDRGAWIDRHRFFDTLMQIVLEFYWYRERDRGGSNSHSVAYLNYPGESVNKSIPSGLRTSYMGVEVMFRGEF